MRFAKWVFNIAGVFGLIVTLPLYFLEAQVGRDTPPAITHAEFYYGFAGLCLAWQLMFLVIGSDPPRFRLAMLPAMVEKFSFFIAVALLYYGGRVAGTMMVMASIDLVLGVLFVRAWLLTRQRD